MQTFLNYLLLLTSPLAAVPTAWAIFAGLRKRPVFPVPTEWAVIGAIAIIILDISAGTLINDIEKFNQGLRNADERTLQMSTKKSWRILIGAIAAEVILSLVVVVIPALLSWAVLVFPLLTLAGVFSFSFRSDLLARQGNLVAMREQKQADKKQAQAERKQELAKKAQAKAAQKAKKAPCKFGCGKPISQTREGYNAHKHYCANRASWPVSTDELTKMLFKVEAGK